MKLIRSIKRTVIILLVAFVLLSIYLSLSLSPILFANYDIEENNNENVVLIAHRGASSIAPENTIASINSAIKLNASFIEIDVRQTSDSILILLHDASLDRTTNGKGLVKDKTYSEISELDAGKWFSEKFKNERIPTLESVIKLVNGRCNLVVEIKEGNDYYPNIEKNILKIIEHHNAEKWISIHSFDSEILKTIHQINSNIKLNKLIFGKFKFLPFIFSDRIEKFEIEELDFVDTYSINYHFANEEILNLLKSNGKKVNVWTVDEPQTAKELISFGVDGIITNDLTILRENKNMKN